MKQIRESQSTQRQERGFNLMPLGHDGVPLSCPAGQPQEISAGIFLTVDAASGSALIEINPQEKRIRVAVDGMEVMDVAQLARGSVLTMDGRDYAFLKYMDVYFNPVAPTQSPRAVTPPRVLPLAPSRPEPVVQVQVLTPSARKIMKLALPAVFVAAAAAALLLLPGKQDAVTPAKKITLGKVAGKLSPRSGRKSAPAPAAAKAPETLRDLMAEEAAPTSAVPAIVAETPAIPTEKPTAIPIKPEPAKQVKPEARPQQVARPAVTKTPPPAAQPALSAEMQKALNREYEEAVLIRGYDRDRSVQILEKLRTKVPAGSALHKKIENALKG